VFHPSSRILQNTENSFARFDYVDGKFTTHVTAMDSSVAYGYNLLQRRTDHRWDPAVLNQYVESFLASPPARYPKQIGRFVNAAECYGDLNADLR
jgi:hypothetical protein